MSNIEVVRMLFGAMAEGRADDAFELLSDDIHWRVAGDLAFCGPHKGKQAVKDNLLSAISARYVPGTTNIKILNLFEDLNRSVVISQILESADLVGGGHTEAEIASFFYVSSGKIDKVEEYVDLRQVVDVMKLR